MRDEIIIRMSRKSAEAIAEEMLNPNRYRFKIKVVVVN